VKFLVVEIQVQLKASLRTDFVLLLLQDPFFYVFGADAVRQCCESKGREFALKLHQGPQFKIAVIETSSNINPEPGDTTPPAAATHKMTASAPHCMKTVARSASRLFHQFAWSPRAPDQINVFLQVLRNLVCSCNSSKCFCATVRLDLVVVGIRRFIPNQQASDAGTRFIIWLPAQHYELQFLSLRLRSLVPEPTFKVTCS
jgi:hypothetical protein